MACCIMNIVVLPNRFQWVAALTLKDSVHRVWRMESSPADEPAYAVNQVYNYYKQAAEQYDENFGMYGGRIIFDLPGGSHEERRSSSHL